MLLKNHWKVLNKFMILFNALSVLIFFNIEFRFCVSKGVFLEII
ncbi:hypothetical protein ASZ90_008364 [hydrocarbon metagenome]|uniref:Uncharacterized protein n=1 Tax=hydrocarbon metagenome TaxID=938273 RepID=A0A0W8FME2_9ZZZZ